MKKVGIYVFTDQIKERKTKKREGFFDGQNYIGLRYIVSEIDKSKYEISYVSKDTINSVDFCLISLTSYYDVINVINELYGKTITAKICMGGAGYNNVGLLRDIAWVGTVGRGGAGELGGPEAKGKVPGHHRRRHRGRAPHAARPVAGREDRQQDCQGGL